MSLQLSVVYPTQKKNRTVYNVARASNFLERTDLQALRNQKALADCTAEILMPQVDLVFDASWTYIGTTEVNLVPYHYFQQKLGQDVCHHLWLPATEISA